MDMAALQQQPTPFMQQFQQNPAGDSNALYNQYLKGVQTPAGPQQPAQGGLMGMLRNILPFMDTAQGHAMLGNTASMYPYTDKFAGEVPKRTIVRTSNDPKVIDEEAETNPSYLGTRSTMQIGAKGLVSPPLSVVNHELMHSYTDKHGFPGNASDFNKAWESSKKTNPQLQTIDSYLRSDPNYADEQNENDITAERHAFLAQQVGAGGLDAFPEQLQPFYAPMFRETQKRNVLEIPQRIAKGNTLELPQVYAGK